MPFAANNNEEEEFSLSRLQLKKYIIQYTKYKEMYRSYLYCCSLHF